MGSSKKPEAAKPAPFVEPPAPRRPVPNWFQRGGAPQARYAPPTGPVRGAFGAQGQPMPMHRPQAPQQAPEVDPQMLEILRRIMAGNGGLM